MPSTVTLCRKHPSKLVYIAAVLVLTILPLVVIIHTLDDLWLQHADLLASSKQREFTVSHSGIHWLNRRKSILRQLKSELYEDRTVSIQGGPLSCRDIETVEMRERLGRGMTKDVYRGVYKGRSIAIKMVTNKVEDIKACMRRNKYHSFSDCFVYANYKLMKEVALSMQLDHPNIIKVSQT